MINYPIVCTDNFLDYPDHLRNYGLSLDYAPDKDGRWPGVRTGLVHEINRHLFVQICERYLALHYTSEDMNYVRYKAAMHFQKIKGDYNAGWIHSDYPDQHTFIVYLTPGSSSSTGTSIYRPKGPIGVIGAAEEWEKVTHPAKVKLYKGKMEVDKADPHRKQHNSRFEETSRFSNLYNRCIGFDSTMWHGANDFKSSEERLTLITFFKFISGPATGLNRSQRINIF